MHVDCDPLQGYDSIIQSIESILADHVEARKVAQAEEPVGDDQGGVTVEEEEERLQEEELAGEEEKEILIEEVEIEESEPFESEPSMSDLSVTLDGEPNGGELGDTDDEIEFSADDVYLRGDRKMQEEEDSEDEESSGEL